MRGTSYSHFSFYQSVRFFSTLTTFYSGLHSFQNSILEAFPCKNGVSANLSVRSLLQVSDAEWISAKQKPDIRFIYRLHY